MKASGAQGSTTPQGKHKHGDKKSKSLKRAGSPALSESSGNESSRKKMKKTAATAPGSRSGTPIPGAARKKKLGAGSTSDGEATAGEMSDGAGPKKKMRLVGSTKGTPSASRAGSPAPAGKSAVSNATLSPSNANRYNRCIAAAFVCGDRTLGDFGKNPRRRHQHRGANQALPVSCRRQARSDGQGRLDQACHAALRVWPG